MKQNNKKLSIKWRLFIYLSIFTGATLLVLWLFQVVLLDSFYKTIKIDGIKLSAESIGKNIDNDSLQQLIERISQDSDISIIIADEAGKVLYSAETIPGSIINRMTIQRFYGLVNNAQSKGGTYIETSGRRVIRDEWNVNNGFSGVIHPQDRGMIESIVYTKIVTKKSGDQVAVVLNAIISPVNATVQTIRIQLVFVTIIMLIFALVLALIISKKISKPIIRINSSSKELAKGNYQVHFDTIGYKEIAELGETLNYATVELSKTENLRKELIANISHDLRTPLTMITGYAEIMRDLPGENVPENLQIIIDEAKRLETLVNDMLDISKLRAGVKELNIEEYNFTENIRNMLKRYEKLIEQDGYTINFIYDSDVIIKADELKISQVIYNLINNSITHTGKNKLVTVRQSINNKRVRIEIIDTGEGIPEDKFKDIWDRYYKVDKEHKRAKIGTGLGLSIVKTILEMHSATYGVKSDIGQGSIFWFELNI